MSVRPPGSFVLLLAGPVLGALLMWAAIAITERPAVPHSDVAPSLVTERIQKRVLESAVITRGDVIETDAFAVTLNGDVGDLEGEPVYTGRIAPAGSNIETGQVLAEVSGRPVIALEGSVPMYRRLTAGTVGADVEQLERQLAQLGFFHGHPDRAFDSATAGAVQALYENLGYEPTRTVSNAEHLEDPAGPPTPKVTVPRGEVVFVPALPRRVASSSVVVGQVPSGAAFTLRGTGAAVIARVSRDQASLVRKRVRVELSDPSSGIETPGRVVAVGKGADPQGNVSIRIAARADISNAVGSNLRVRIPFSSTSGAVLAVSPAAVYTAEDGRTYVDRVMSARGSGEDSTRIQVRLGLVADALVEIEPVSAKLEPGDRLVISAR